MRVWASDFQPKGANEAGKSYKLGSKGQSKCKKPKRKPKR